MSAAHPREAQHLVLRDLPRESLLGGTFERTAVRGDGSLVTFNWLDPAMPHPPLHDHPFDQISLVTEGSMQIQVEGETFTVRAGEVVLIPAGARHTGWATGDGVALNIDVFAPARADYLHLAAHQDPDGMQFGAADVPPQDRVAIHDLLLAWCDAVDQGRPHDVADLITEDALIIGVGPDRHGPTGLREWADARAAMTDRRSFHQVSNLRCTARADGTVAVAAKVAVHVIDDQHPQPYVALLADYADVVTRTDAGWRFARRTVTAFA